MTTWRDYATGQDAAVTTWNYGARRGWLVKKVYQGETDTTDDYEYKLFGRLWKRHWERGITTTYAYNNTGDLSTVDYSDTTLDITRAYDRLNRLQSISSTPTSASLPL